MAKKKGKKGKPKTAAQKQQNKTNKIDRRLTSRTERLQENLSEAGMAPRSAKEHKDSLKRLGRHRGYR